MFKKYLALLSTVFLLSTPALAEPLKFVTQSGKEIAFDVEIANTDATREKGLMNRDSLPPNTGMLFIFDTPTEPMFWMKDTKIRLDLIYINEQGQVIGVHNNAIPFDTTPIMPPGTVIAVLETSGGAAKKLGISTGDKVIHSIFEKDVK